MSYTFKITNGDVTLGNNGQPLQVTGKAKLGQDLREATVVPTNDIGFGFGLAELVGTVDDPASVPSTLDSSISAGLLNMQTLQQQNQRLVRTDDELIDTIQSVQAGPVAPGNNTDFNFSYSVNTVAGDKPVKQSGAVTL